MTAAGQAQCGRCAAPIGVNHPIFTTRRDTGYSWQTFSGCRICGALRCASCAAGLESRCDVCGDPLAEDVSPLSGSMAYRSGGRGVATPDLTAPGRPRAAPSVGYDPDRRTAPTP